MNKRKSAALEPLLRSLGNKEKTAYSDLAGIYDYRDFELEIDHIPVDTPSITARLRASVKLENAKFPKDVFNTKSREVAARDFIARAFGAAAAKFSVRTHGVQGGKISIEPQGRELLEISSVVTGASTLEARFTTDLPLRRERIDPETALEIFLVRIPKIVRSSLYFANVNGDELANWLEMNEDADAIRDMLPEKKLAAFVANRSILAGRGNVKEIETVFFQSPPSLEITLEVPNRGKIIGMGIPEGLTVLSGARGQGKSTLIRALELGVYNHIPGDGREFIITRKDAAGIRIEEGRRIEQVDISPLWGKLKDPVTTSYGIWHAPPSASLSANIMESLEIGTSLLLFDEENITADLMQHSCTKPDSRESGMGLQEFLPALARKGISSIIAVSNHESFDGFADTILKMEKLRVSDITAEIHKRAAGKPLKTINEIDLPAPRCPLAHSMGAVKQQQLDRDKLKTRGMVAYGDELIDLSKIPQIVSQSQVYGIARGIALVQKMMDGSNSLAEAVYKVIQRVEVVGLDTLSNRRMGDLAVFRAHELAAAVNRMKKLKVK